SPYGDDAKNMRCSAEHDESREKQEHPVKNDILPLPHKINQGNGNGKISEGNQKVGNNMQYDQISLAIHALVTRDIGLEKIPKKTITNGLHMLMVMFHSISSCLRFEN